MGAAAREEGAYHSSDPNILAVCRSPCLGPGGCRSIWAAAAERGFVLHESVSVGCSQPGLAGTEKPCFLEYKICSLPSLPGPQRVALPSLEDQRPGLFLQPSPLLKLQQLVPRGGLQGLTPPTHHHQMSTPKIASIKLSLTLEMQPQDQSYHMLLLSMPASQFSVHYLNSPKISSRFFFWWGEPKRRADLGRRGERMGEGGRIQSMKPGSELCISYKQAGVSDGKSRRAEHRFCSTRAGSIPHGITF